MTPIVKMQFGSHVYGTSVPTSDQDFKSIKIPDARDILLQKAFKTTAERTKIGTGKNTKDDVDHEIFSLHYWFKLLGEGQTVCYDMLFTPEKYWIDADESQTAVWEIIRQNKDKLVNSQISAFAGYCQHQAAKYSIKGSNLAAYRKAMDFFAEQPSQLKLQFIRDKIVESLVDTAVLDAQYSDKEKPLIQLIQIPHKNHGKDEEYLQVGPKTKVPMAANCKLAHEIFKSQFDKYGERAKMAESNQGVDWKALLHAVRVCGEAEELLRTGNITFPRPNADVLLKIRRGEMAYKAVEQMITDGLDALSEAKTKTTLRDKPDFKWMDDFIVYVHGNEVMRFLRSSVTTGAGGNLFTR